MHKSLVVAIFTIFLGLIFLACKPLPLMIADKIINAPLFSEEEISKRPIIGIVEYRSYPNIAQDIKDTKEKYLTKTTTMLSQYANVKKIEDFYANNPIKEEEFGVDSFQLGFMTTNKMYTQAYQTMHRLNYIHKKDIYALMKKNKIDSLIILSSDGGLLMDNEEIIFGLETDIVTLKDTKVVLYTENNMREDRLLQYEKNINVKEYWSDQSRERTNQEKEKLQIKIDKMVEKQVSTLAKILFGVEN